MKRDQREHGDDGGGWTSLLVGGTAGPCTGLGGRPVDTSSGPRNTLQAYIWYARPNSDRSEMSCLATSMCEINNLFYPSTGVKEVLLHVVSLPCFCNSLSVFQFKLVSNLVILGEKKSPWGHPTPPRSPAGPVSVCLFAGWLDPPDRQVRRAPCDCVSE